MTSRLTASPGVANQSEYARKCPRFAPCQPGASPVPVPAPPYTRAAGEPSGRTRTAARPGWDGPRGGPPVPRGRPLPNAPACRRRAGVGSADPANGRCPRSSTRSANDRCPPTADACQQRMAHSRRVPANGRSPATTPGDRLTGGPSLAGSGNGACPGAGAAPAATSAGDSGHTRYPAGRGKRPFP